MVEENRMKTILATLFAAGLGALAAAQTPPPKPLPLPGPIVLLNSVKFTFRTGGDDLRGGNDNVDAFIVTKDGKCHRFDNLNKGANWANNSTHTESRPFGKYGFEDIAAVRLETRATGGIAGDNWNLDFFQMDMSIGGDTKTLVKQSGAPIIRFTGDARVKQFMVGAGPAPKCAPVMTNFDPTKHGFNFANMFKFPVIAFDIAWSGLCGGMSYTALDQYYSGNILPKQSYMPAPRSPFHNWLFSRQITSIQFNLDKWTELFVNPGGARNREFFTWGLQVGSGRLGELLRMIDAGKPCPLGLQEAGIEYMVGSEKRKTLGSHQVVAVGYDLGRYFGDPTQFASDLKIFVYDPNSPGVIKTLRPNLTAGDWYYDNGAGGVDLANRWRTYFVDMKYATVRPNVAVGAAPKNEIWLRFVTGGDDLRGGNDNVHVVVLLRDGRQIRFDNFNGGNRWMNNSINEGARRLPDTVNPGDVVGVRLETTFGGGIGGDNWNLDQLSVFVRTGLTSGWTTTFDQKSAPLFRFTGDQKVREFRW